MRLIVEDMDIKTARSFLLHALDIEVPKRDEDGELVEEVTDWLDEWHEDWTDRFEENFAGLFDENSIREKYLLSANDVDTLRKSGLPPCIQAVVTIHLDNWC